MGNRIGKEAKILRSSTKLANKDLTKDKIKKYRKLWIDTFGKDKHELTQSEFLKWLKLINLFPGMDYDRAIKHVFKIFDKDKNNGVSFQEFIMFVSTLHQPKTVEQMIEDTFHLYDEDQDGVLTREELEKGISDALQAVGEYDPKKVKARVDKLMEGADTSKDGKIGLLEIQMAVKNNPGLAELL